jgi:carbonic anhydrase
MVKKLSAILLTTAAKFALASSNAAHGENLFSYDPAAVNGPSKWSSLDLGETANACNGSKQSGIDIPTSSCNETNADYKFEVSGTYNVTQQCFSKQKHTTYKFFLFLPIF